MPDKASDMQRAADAEQLSSLIAAWAQKRRGKAVSITFHRDDAELLFRTIDARDAALREKDAEIERLRDYLIKSGHVLMDAMEHDRLRAAQPATDATAVVEAARKIQSVRYTEYETLEMFKALDALDVAVIEYDSAPPVDRAVKHSDDMNDKVLVGLAIEEATAAERAAIVAWLRTQAITQKFSQYDARRHEKAGALMHFAAAIERGEHSQPGGES